MKIGMNLLLYTTRPDESTFPIGEKLRKMGYDGLEWPLFEMSHEFARRVHAFNRDQGLGATAVFAFGPGTNPVSDSASERQAALDALKERIDLTKMIGGNLLCGPIVQPLGHFTGRGPTSEEWGRCVEFLRAAGEHAAKTGVTLAVEYLNRFEIYLINTAADAARLCREVNHPNVRTMVDSFHANIEEENQYDAVLAAREYLVHIHVSENTRGIPGKGKAIRWEDLFRGLREVRYDGWLTIEAFGQFLPDLAAAAKIWRPLFANPDDVCTQGLAFVQRMLKA